MSATPEDVVRRWFEEVWNQGRFETIDELYAADGIAHGLGEPGADVRGPAGFRPFAERFRSAFPDIRITVVDTIAEGEKIATRWTATLTHTGDQLGVPATGKQATVDGMTIAYVRDGQIVESWNNWDIAGLMRQLEAGPQMTIVE
jgi:steroid delta-isomerase-like uncharacterized protein